MPVSTIQFGPYGYLDLTEDAVVPLNFGIASVQDISKRSGTFSKTIKLPGTANNRRLMQQLYKSTTDDTFLSPERNKQEVIIRKNGTSIFTGYLQLLSANKKSPTSPVLDEIVDFDVAVKDDAGDFFSSMGDDLVETLGGKFLQSPYSAHSFTFNKVMSTSAHTWQNIYKYFIPCLEGRSCYTLPDFNCAISAKAIWDEIWREAGYTYQWSSLSATGLHNLWLPYVGDRIKRDIGDKVFKATVSADTTYNFGALPLNGHCKIPTNNTTIPGLASPIQPITFETEVSDPSNCYNPVNGQYSTNLTGSVETVTTYNVKIYLDNVSGKWMRFGLPTTVVILCYPGDPVGQASSFTMRLKASIRDANYTKIQEEEIWSRAITGGLVGATSNELAPGLNLMGETTYTTRCIADASNGTQKTIRNYLEGLYGEMSKDQNGKWYGNWIYTDTSYPADIYKVASQADHPVYKIVVEEGSSFKNEITTVSDEGSTAYLSDALPKQMKRKDFVSSIVKMFNLYISPTDQDRVLKVETRDEFYDASTTIRDWTRKLASERDTKLQFLPEIQSKKLLFTYKPDKDPYNADYLQRIGETFGQLEYTFDYDFSQETKKVELIFSPTQLQENRTGQICPTIAPREPKCNWRILYDGGMINMGIWIYSGASTSGQIRVMRGYPYMGPLTHPLSGAMDYHFGQTDFVYYDWESYGATMSNNNLYNKYYRRYLTQIESGRLLKGKFRLTELDIAQLNLRDKIWVGDSYYYVNRIIDYDCNSVDGLTDVELINIDEGVRFNVQTFVTPGGTGTGGFGGGWTKPIVNDTVVIGGTGGGTVNGSFNTVQPNATGFIVNGSGNNIAGTSNQINGQGNTLATGKNNIVQGNGNKIN